MLSLANEHSISEEIRLVDKRGVEGISNRPCMTPQGASEKPHQTSYDEPKFSHIHTNRLQSYKNLLIFANIWGKKCKRKHYVFFGHGFAYSVDDEPNEAFKEDMIKGIMVDVETAKTNFVQGRTRLVINYKRDWLEARVTPQHSGVWGQSGKGAFNLYETWAKLTARNGLFAQVGRVALSYDDERIIGSDNWAMASQSHDVLRMGYEGHGHKAHVILAYNQNADVLTTGGNYYVAGGQPYKTMQDLWYHYDLPKFPLGISVLFMNIGMENEDNNYEEQKTWYQQLLGGHLSFRPKLWNAEASYYHQMGKSESGLKIDAWMASGKVSFAPKANYGFVTGYDYLSGDKDFAVPPHGGL